MVLYFEITKDGRARRVEEWFQGWDGGSYDADIDLEAISR